QAQADSPNGAWRNAAFQGYADHMTSAEFADGLAQALDLAATTRTALLGAEAVWWRRHRRPSSDLLQPRGCGAPARLAARPAQPHPGNPDARAQGEDLVYPPRQAGLF